MTTPGTLADFSRAMADLRAALYAAWAPVLLPACRWLARLLERGRP
jgi:hypothetical protein